VSFFSQSTSWTFQEMWEPSLTLHVTATNQIALVTRISRPPCGHPQWPLSLGCQSLLSGLQCVSTALAMTGLLVSIARSSENCLSLTYSLRAAITPTKCNQFSTVLRTCSIFWLLSGLLSNE
jgi:hypothetical protein